MKIYKLHFDDLVDPESRYQGHGLKPLNMAVYNCQGVDTTMFFKHEVEERAKVVHGDYFYDGKVHKKKKGDDMDGGLRDTVPRTKKK